MPTRGQSSARVPQWFGVVLGAGKPSAEAVKQIALVIHLRVRSAFLSGGWGDSWHTWRGWHRWHARHLSFGGGVTGMTGIVRRVPEAFWVVSPVPGFPPPPGPRSRRAQAEACAAPGGTMGESACSRTRDTTRKPLQGSAGSVD